jgi:hypothetical protein
LEAVMGRFRRSRRRAQLGLAVGAVAFIGLIAIATALKPGAMDPIQSCKADSAAPVITVAVDASNALGHESQAMLRVVIEENTRTQRGARVIIARVSGAQAYRPEILFDRCDPGSAAQAKANEGPAALEVIRTEQFVVPLNRVIKKLARPAAHNDTSYIADTVIHIAADPAMHLTGPNAKLIVLTDLLENTDRSTPYLNGRISLPTVHERFLRGIKVRVIELPAIAKAAGLQTFEVRAIWRAWLAAAGAENVEVVAPGLRPA